MLKDLLFNHKYFENIFKEVFKIFMFFIVGIAFLSFVFTYFVYQENLVNLIDFSYKFFLNNLAFIIIIILFYILGLIILKNRTIFKRYFYLLFVILVTLIFINNIFYYYSIYRKQPSKSTTLNFSKYLYFYNNMVNNINENSNFWIVCRGKNDVVMLTNINGIAINTNQLFFDYYDPFLSFEKWYLLKKDLTNIFFFHRFNYILSLFGFKYLFHYNLFYSDFDKIVINDLYNIKSIELNKYKLNNIFMVPIYNRNLKNELIERAVIDNNKIILSKDKPIIFYIPYFKKYNNLCLGLKIKKTKEENILSKFYRFIMDKREIIYLAPLSNDNRVVDLVGYYSFFISYEEYRYIMIPFSLVKLVFDKYKIDNFLYEFNNEKFLKFIIANEFDIEYEIESIDIYYYHDYYNPGFYSKEYLTYQKVVTNKLHLDSRRTFDTFIYKNHNSMDMIDSVIKLGIIKNIFELKKDILLVNFNFKEEAKIYPEYIQKLKEYSKINQLKYQNNYANVTEKNINNLNFVNSEITDREIFKKNNEISFKVRSKGDSFVIINHSYYKYWKGYIDDIEVPVLKVNGIVMGIIIPKGEHKVVLRYEPWYTKFFFVPFIVVAIYFIIIMILLNPKLFLNPKN